MMQAVTTPERAWTAPGLDDLRSAPELPIESVAPLAIGGLHDLYRVSMEHGREPFVLKVGAPHAWEALGSEAAMTSHVSDAGLDCPRVIRGPHGTGLFSIENMATGMSHPAIIMTEIVGRNPLSAADYEDVGEALGRLHQVPPPPIAQRYDGFGVDTGVSGTLPRPIEQRVGSAARSVQSGLATLAAHLRRGLCHGDLFPTNVMTTSSGTAFLDFGNMGEDHSCVDLGRMVFALSLEYGWSGSRERAWAFLRGYDRTLPIDTHLLAVVPLIAFLAGVRIAAWRYRAAAERLVAGARLADWQQPLDLANEWLDRRCLP